MNCTKIVFCILLLFLTTGCTKQKSQGILAWDPTPQELPIAQYPTESLSEGASGWNWTGTSDHEIQDVLVAPPIHKENPYLLNQDYEGHLEGNVAHIHFISAGVYTVKFIFKDPKQPPYIKFLYAGAASSGIAKP